MDCTLAWQRRIASGRRSVKHMSIHDSAAAVVSWPAKSSVLMLSRAFSNVSGLRVYNNKKVASFENPFVQTQYIITFDITAV